LYFCTSKASKTDLPLSLLPRGSLLPSFFLRIAVPFAQVGREILEVPTAGRGKDIYVIAVNADVVESQEILGKPRT
jgi:hypothetical protein